MKKSTKTLENPSFLLYKGKKDGKHGSQGKPREAKGSQGKPREAKGMSGLLSCAYELLEKNLITATVLMLGIPLIIFFIPKIMNSSLSNPFQGVVIQKLSPWRQTLTGETINLPNKDVQGFAISKETSHIVYSMPCSSCSKPEDIDKYLMQSVKKPFILIFVGEWEEVPALFKNRPNDYLILCDKEANYAPKDFLSHAPQIARLNSAGIITEVPKENEELSEFLKRGDTK